MFRMGQILRNNIFLNSLRRSSQVNPAVVAPEVICRIIRRKCTESSDQPPIRNEVTTAQHTRPTEPYLIHRSRSAIAEIVVKAVLSSPNGGHQIGNLPSIKELACGDLVSMLVTFDDAGLPLDCAIMHTLVEEITNQMKNDPESVSLHTMANFTLFANKNRNQMNKYFLCLDVIAPLYQRLASCEGLDEMYYLTICLLNLNRICTRDAIELYKAKLNGLIESGKLISDSHLPIIFKILQFLNVSPWSFSNSSTFRTILQMLLPRIEQLSDQDLADMLIMFHVHSEPGAIVAPIVRLAEKRLEQSSPSNIPLLYCSSMSADPEKSERIMKCIDTYLDTPGIDVINDGLLFQTMRQCNQTTSKVFNKYWSKVTAQLVAMDPKQTPEFPDMLMKVCHRYSHFENSQRGMNRYLPFEKSATKLAFDEIKTGISGMIPRDFVKFATFLLGYGSHQMTNRFPDSFIQKMEGMVRQYTVHDMIQLSHGLKLFYTRENCNPSKSMRSRMKGDMSNQMCRVENLLDARIERYVANEHKAKQLVTLNKLLSIYSASKIPGRTVLFDNLIKLFEEETKRDSVMLSSRIILDVTGNLSRINCMMPTLNEKIIRYMYDNRSMISGKLVASTIHNLYITGFEPSAELLLPAEGHSHPQEICFEDFGAIISRDFELLPGLHIVRACLGLAFYRALPMELIGKVFDISFFKRLEQEIIISNANGKYSTRSMNSIMQLNRAVCFAYPEARIPWFQQNYIEAHISSVVPKNTRFQEDVSKMLASFIDDKSLIETNHVTPYGYRIPFVLYFNSNKEIVRPPQKQTYELTKFAIIPLEKRSYCYNTNTPRGEELLQERHLGMLGFNVIQICYGDWNKMHMNLPGAKTRFLRKLLNLN